MPRLPDPWYRLIWLFSGSHDLSELTHAQWPSYFVSLRTIELNAFTEAETRLLHTEPMQRSDLWVQVDLKRPRFDAPCWGEAGIERIHSGVAGWPHLVQLLAEGVVELVNLRGLDSATPEVLDEVIGKAVVRGEAMLRQLVRNECPSDAEWDYLRGFRSRDLQPIPQDEAIFQSLRRRWIVSEEAGQWRMRVPLMQRWLRERG